MDILVPVSFKNDKDELMETLAFPGRFAPLDGTLSTIGCGNQASIHPSVDTLQNNKPVVLKKYNLDLLNEDQAKELTREWQTLRLCKHPNIVSFVDAFIVEPQFYIVLEKMESNLHDFIQNHHTHNRIDVTAWIAIQLLRALEHLQDLSIMHRDIKPKNIGWNKGRCTVKLLDLGFARIAKDGQDGLTEKKGSPMYMAPELLFGNPNLRTYDCKVDVWSLFVALCELPTREPLFCSSDSSASFLKKSMARVCGLPENSVLERLGYPRIGANSTSTAPLFPEKLPTTAFCANSDNNDGVTVDNFYDLLEKVLTFDYKERYSVQDCLSHNFLHEYAVHRCPYQKPEYKAILREEVKSQGKHFDLRTNSTQ